MLEPRHPMSWAQPSCRRGRPGAKPRTRPSTTGGRPMLPKQVADIPIPDSALAAEATELVRDTESQLLFDHSLRVYLFGALQGRRLGLKYDPEMLYMGAIFHDMG